MIIIRPGSQVQINGQIPGTIHSVRIWSDMSIQYEVRWWDGRTLKSDWFTEGTIVPNDYSDTKRIGFRDA